MSSDILYLVEAFSVNDRIESDHVPVELLRGEGNSDTIKIEDKAVKRVKKVFKQIR